MSGTTFHTRTEPQANMDITWQIQYILSLSPWEFWDVLWFLFLANVKTDLDFCNGLESLPTTLTVVFHEFRLTLEANFRIVS
jgi:hypothetical protein